MTGSRNEAIKPRLKLREILAQLTHIYCGTIGAEFAHVSAETERLWLQERFQVGRMHHPSRWTSAGTSCGPDVAEGIERYLQRATRRRSASRSRAATA